MQGSSWFEMTVAKNEEEQLYLPPGFRFHPTDPEIIDKYLCRKVANPRFTSIAMGDVDLNKCEPWELPSKAKMGEKEWYFFAQKDMKYPTGTRTNRATKNGYWKATGKDKEIYSIRNFGNINTRVLVGMKKTLVFYMGRAPKGDKTNWVMHEFRLEGKSANSTGTDSKMVARDEWVVCRVYEKKNPNSNRSRDEATETDLSNSYDEQEIMNLLNDPSNYNSKVDISGSSVTTGIEASSAPTMPNFNSNFSGMTQANQVLLPNSFSSSSSSQVRINQPWVDNHGFDNLGLIPGQGMANSVVVHAPMNNFERYQLH